MFFILLIHGANMKIGLHDNFYWIGNEELNLL